MHKRRDRCTLFLDDCFGHRDLAEKLREAGFLVETFRDHFRVGQSLSQSVKDPQIIAFCDQQGWLLVTSDKEMEYTHRAEIANSQIGILATASNNDDMLVWVPALIKAKAKIERDFKKHQRPYCSRLTRDGNLHTRTIMMDRVSRRDRPGEKSSQSD